MGVLGRFGDLATIPEKYDVAVSTACGVLDHIVVQTTAGAQRCLEFLRKHNLGRASFIPLDKMKKGAHDRQVETPEGAPRLFELIVPSNYAITPAIFMAVSNTLVAPDLETATRWAYDFSKRWRVVTLDGALIESTGTMAGGGKQVRRGGMRISVSPVELMRLGENYLLVALISLGCFCFRTRDPPRFQYLQMRTQTLSVKGSTTRPRQLKDSCRNVANVVASSPMRFAR